MAVRKALLKRIQFICILSDTLINNSGILEHAVDFLFLSVAYNDDLFIVPKCTIFFTYAVAVVLI